jgi:hypothetical protein
MSRSAENEQAARQADEAGDAAAPADADGTENAGTGGVKLVKTAEMKPEGYQGTCLRPLGLCELGGACDTCWYSPFHPRNRGKGASDKTPPE